MKKRILMIVLLSLCALSACSHHGVTKQKPAGFPEGHEYYGL